MREIKKLDNMSKVPNLDSKNKSAAEPQFFAETEETGLKTDFSNPTEVLGRSQVNKPDNIKEDVAFGIANPNAINNSDKLFEIAYKSLQSKGDPEAYEKACAISTSKDARELLS